MHASDSITGMTLPVMEHYFTIQGEGANTGQAAYFIRLGGCDVGCVWCDVKESWNANAHPQYPLETLVQWAKDAGASRVVITGGEPCMYDLGLLTRALREAGLRTYLETSGAYPVTGHWDWVCVSPKKFKKALPESLQRADELKVVVYNRHDFSWAVEQASGTRPESRKFLQPEYSVLDKMLPEIIGFVKLHPEWTISLQTHKFMQIP
jgi:organic radical activating enzyme